MAGDLFDQVHAEAQAPPPVVAAGASGDLFDQVHAQAQGSSPAAPAKVPWGTAPPKNVADLGLPMLGTPSAGPSPAEQVYSQAKSGDYKGAAWTGAKAVANSPELQTVAGEGLTSLGSKLWNALPSAERAGQAFQDVSKVAGQHTVPITNELSDSLQKVSTLAKSGLTMPKVVGDFIDRTSDLKQLPISYDEARNFYSTVANKLSPDEIMKLTPRMKAALGEFKVALGDTIADTAEQAGKLDKYHQAMEEYRKAMALKNFGQTVWEGAKKSAIGALGTGIGYELLKKTIGAAMGGR